MVDPQTQRNRDMIDTLFAMPVKHIAVLPKEAAANYRTAIQDEMQMLSMLAQILPHDDRRLPL